MEGVITEIDSSIISPYIFAYHHQAEPNPGGHTYKILVANGSVRERIAERLKLRAGFSGEISSGEIVQETSRSVVSLLLAELNANDSDNSPIEWVLNNVERIGVDQNGQIEICGQASSFETSTR